MKILICTSGKFAHPEPCKPIMRLKKGEEVEVDMIMGKSLIESGWGEPVVPAPPVDLESMTKKELEDHADTIGLIDLNPNLKKADMIAEIRKHHG
jgi:hypothetical protein